nr:Chain B, A LIGAND PEPTIDE [synthetic construct]
RHYRPLPPLP